MQNKKFPDNSSHMGSLTYSHIAIMFIACLYICSKMCPQVCSAFVWSVKKKMGFEKKIALFKRSLLPPA